MNWQALARNSKPTFFAGVSNMAIFDTHQDQMDIALLSALHGYFGSILA
jgi:hypothetical protein